MSHTVFILGAGASADAGAPVMSNFIDVAERLMTSGRDGEEREHFSLVFRGIHELERVYAKSAIDTDNFESVFVAFEMAALLGRLGNLAPEEVAKLPSAMARLITRTLEQTIDFPSKAGAILPPASYDKFAKFVSTHTKSAASTVAILTFNYDVALDYALAFNEVPVDYALEGTSRGNAVDLLKLHGSLGWGRDANGKMLPVRFAKWSHAENLTPLDIVRSGRQLLSTFSKAGAVHGPIEPVIVPPTWSKAEHHRKLAAVWQRAADHLREADRVIVCGYSLPPTDEFFRYLFALGTVGPTRIKAFYACDAFPNDAIDERYRRLLGPKVTPRYKLAEYPFSWMASQLEDGSLTTLESAVRGYAYPRR